jgi:hypothetical protein
MLSAVLGHVIALLVKETNQYCQKLGNGILTAMIWREKQDILILANVHHPPTDMGCTDRGKG